MAKLTYHHERTAVDQRDPNTGLLIKTVYQETTTRTWDCQDGKALFFNNKFGTKLYNHTRLNQLISNLKDSHVAAIFRLTLNLNQRGEICRYDPRSQRLIPLKSENEIRDYLGMKQSSWYNFRHILIEHNIYQEITKVNGSKRFLFNPVYAVESHNYLTEDLAFIFGNELDLDLSPNKQELLQRLRGEAPSLASVTPTTINEDDIVIAPPRNRADSNSNYNEPTDNDESNFDEDNLDDLPVFQNMRRQIRSNNELLQQVIADMSQRKEYDLLHTVYSLMNPFEERSVNDEYEKLERFLIQ